MSCKFYFFMELTKHWRVFFQTNHIETVNINNLIPGLFEHKVKLMKAPWEWGDLNGRQISLLCFLVKHLKAKNIFEFGTFRGRTTLNLALNTNDDGHVYTLDLPSPQVSSSPTNGFERTYMRALQNGARTGEIFKSNDVEERIRVKISPFLCDSKAFDFSSFYGKMNMVFVDGGHTLDVVASDGENALKMIHDKGIVIWDDYQLPWPGVKFYLNTLSHQKRLYRDVKTGLVLHSPAW